MRTILAVVMLVWASAAASRVDVFVDPSRGSDKNPGTSQQPVATIQKAISIAESGSGGGAAVVHLSAGGNPHQVSSTLFVPSRASKTQEPLQFTFQPWDSAASPSGRDAGNGSYAVISGLAPQPFRNWATTSPPMTAWTCNSTSDAVPSGWCSIQLSPGLDIRADHMDLFWTPSGGAGSTPEPQRLTRVRTETLFWEQTLNPANSSDPVNAQGFVVAASDLAGLSRDAASLAGWKVWAFHSWSKSRHTVRSIEPTSSRPEAEEGERLDLRFQETSRFLYGSYTYCSLERYYVEGARDLLSWPESKRRGDFLILPADDSAPANTTCNTSNRCVLFVRQSLVEEGGSFGLPVLPELFVAGMTSEADTSFRATEAAVLGPDIQTVGQEDRFGIRRLRARLEAAGRQGLHTPLAPAASVNLTFNGLVLEGTTTTCQTGTACDGDSAATTDTAAIRVQNGPGLNVANATMRMLGGWGIKVVLSPTSRIQDVRLENVGAGGIEIFSHGSSAAGPSLVQRVTVQRFGQTMPNGPGVSLCGKDITVDSCEMTGGYYNGFVAVQSDGWSEGSVLSNSWIHDNGHTDDLGICDFGALHVGGAGAALPMYITDNVFMNISAFQNGGNGIYMDVSATGFVLERNLVYQTLDSPFYWHVNPFVPMNEEAFPVQIHNNFFVANYEPPNRYKLRAHEAIMKWFAYTAANMSHNIVYVQQAQAAGTVNFVYDGQPCAKIENPKVVGPGCTDTYASSFHNVTMANNLYWNATGSLTNTFPNNGDLSSWQRTAGPDGLPHDANSIVADPLFVDPAGGNFHMHNDSPALALGIEQLM